MSSSILVVRCLHSEVPPVVLRTTSSVTWVSLTLTPALYRLVSGFTHPRRRAIGVAAPSTDRNRLAW